MSALVPSLIGRRRLGNALVVLGAVVALLSAALPGARALEGTVRAATPSALSVALSSLVVGDGEAEAFIVAPDDAPHDLLGVPAALATFPGPTSLLLTSRGVLTSSVEAEVDRVRNARTVAYVINDADVAAALEARGLTVNLVEGATPTDVAVALANQTFGVAAGHGQRLVLTGTDPLVAGLANAYGVNLGIPVIPAAAGWSSDAHLREVVVIAAAGEVTDEMAGVHPGDPVVTRVEASSLDALGEALGQRLADEPLDGFLEGRVGTATIVLDSDETDPHPALLSAVASAAHALDGLDATVRVVPSDAVPPVAGPILRLGLNLEPGPAPEPPPPPAPLPATGGGLLFGAVLAIAGLRLRTR